MAALRVGTGREDRAVSGAQAHRIKLIAHLTRCLTFPLCATVVGAGKGRGVVIGVGMQMEMKSGLGQRGIIN